MDETTLRGLLAAVREGGTSVDAAVRRLKGAPFERLGDVATLDTQVRQLKDEVQGRVRALTTSESARRRDLEDAEEMRVRLRDVYGEGRAGAPRREGVGLRPGLPDAAARPHGGPGPRAGRGLLRGHLGHPGLRGGGGHPRRTGWPGIRWLDS